MGSDYRDGERIAACDLLITYTCDIVPSAAELPALHAFLAHGGRWIALHGTNSLLAFAEDGRALTPDTAPEFMELLGTRFLGHPPIEPFEVRIVDPDHDLTRGLRDFAIEDELYVSQRTAPIEVLMAARFAAECPDFVDRLAPDDEVPILYERRVGEGAILYCTLGHCRGHYDLQPLRKFWPHPQRCSWDYPIFREILRRGIQWGVGGQA